MDFSQSLPNTSEQTIDVNPGGGLRDLTTNNVGGGFEHVVDSHNIQAFDLEVHEPNYQKRS